MKTVLSIAGSDPSGGAGIQALGLEGFARGIIAVRWTEKNPLSGFSFVN